MKPNTLFFNGREVPCKPGWLQLDDTIGVHRNTRLGFQIETTGAWKGDLTWNGMYLHSLGPRSRRTLRYGEAIPDPYYYPGHGMEDFRDGGLHGMDLAGVACRPHDWDRLTARSPVFGLIDPKTGKARPLSEIAMPDIGVYSLERVGPTSILPEYGKTVETPMNGQHWLRASCWGALLTEDEFLRRDRQAIVRDMALAWDRKKAARMLKEPASQGSPEVGREWAFVAIAACDAQDKPMMERMKSIALHVQTPYGNLQINSGGNPAPPPGRWFSDAEAHYQVVALHRLGLKREAAKLASVCVANGRVGKYIEVNTGRGSGAPTDLTAWGAMGCGVYDAATVRTISGKWKVGPNHSGQVTGPYADPALVSVKLKGLNAPGKTRTVAAILDGGAK